MRRSNTAIAFSNRLEHYTWQSSDDEDDVAGSAATATRVAPPQSAHRLSDSTGPATSVPLPPTPSQSSSSVPPNAAMALPRSNRRSDHSRVLLASNIHGVVSATRLADMTRHIDNLNRPAIRSPAHVPPTAPRHAPHLSVVDHPSGIADRPSPTVDCPPAHPATTRHRSDPYHLVRAHQRVAPAHSNIDNEADYIDEWRSYRVNLLKNKRWWEWDHGIIDLRALFPTRSTALAGTQLNVGFEPLWVGVASARMRIQNRHGEDVGFQVGAIPIIVRYMDTVALVHRITCPWSRRRRLCRGWVDWNASCMRRARRRSKY